MEIVKQLNLNGNPQVVPTGSLVYAKNIKLSDDGTYITNDDGFSSVFITEQPSSSNLKVSNVVGTFVPALTVVGINYTTASIVGYINCPNEIVLFVYKEYESEGETISLSEIYRAVEIKNDTKLALYKVPNSWKYDGGKIIGTYTYNVYNHLIIAISEYDASVDKQLMTIDLNDSFDSDTIDKYSCAPNIPICNLTLAGKIKGNPMPHGLYYFFVRYEISDKIYTNWFPIGAPQYALSLDYKTIINHRYAINSSGTTTKYTQASALVNTEGDSYYNFSFVIEFTESNNYKGYQIGYILQTEDTAVGRLWKTFSFNDGITKSFTFNGGYDEEISLEDFSNNVINVYNVKALTNYNSKLYIGNFKETKYNVIDDEIQSCVDRIYAVQVKHLVNTNAQEEGTTVMNTWTYTINGTSVSITVPQDVSSIPFTDFPALANLIDDAMNSHYTFTGVGYNLVFSEEGITVNPEKEYGGKDNSDNDWYYYTGKYEDSGFIWKYYRYLDYGPDASGEWVSGSYGRIKSGITITKNTGVQNYKTYNSDVTIRTLMPHEVYAFYVHFVRPDGSFTNGYPLDNKAIYSNLYSKRLRELTSSEASNLHLEGMVTIDELKDKYVYELYFPEYIDSLTLTEPFFPYQAENGRKLFRTGTGLVVKPNSIDILRIGVQFYNIHYPRGYVGCFFTYEKVKNLSVYQAVVTDKLTDNNSILCKANDVEFAGTRYDGTVFVPHHKINPTTGEFESIANEPWYAYINNAAPVLSNAQISFLGANINRTGLHGGIAMNLSSDENTVYQPDEYVVGNILTFDRALYSEDNKELIPFGPVTSASTYGEIIDPNDTTINYNMNYPSFIVEDKLLVYKEPIYIDEKLAVHKIVNDIIDPDVFYTDNDYASVNTIWKFSNINLLALSIKKEPEDAAGVIDNTKNTLNTIVKPVNASDLFKLESCYIQKTHKAYTNYNVKINEQNVFTDVIRASYPIRNESNVNSWRILDPLAYHVIDSANGEIVNIFGAGPSFYIHTKNNLLVTSSNAKLEANNTEIAINNNSIFDVEPKEIFTSDLGYGGIKYNECQIFTQFGYIWYDTDRRKLFRYDNGQLHDINSGIDELLKKYKYEYCYINIDNVNNRLLFSFVKDSNTLTMSYETFTGNWISIHDFIFDKNIHTVNIALFTHSVKAPTNIYYYDSIQNKADYELLFESTPNLPSYCVDSNAKYCCFDIICNSNYIIPKTLDSISWAHELILANTLDNNHPAELKDIFASENNKLNNISGLKLIVYSDAVDSGVLDLNPDNYEQNSMNGPTDYKHPYYNKGVWNYNYFRNDTKEYLTESELEALCNKYGIDEDSAYFAKLKKVYKVMDKNNTTIYRSSDMNSLVYGKYFVVRFIFVSQDYKLKFDNLVFNIKQY